MSSSQTPQSEVREFYGGHNTPAVDEKGKTPMRNNDSITPPQPQAAATSSVPQPVNGQPQSPRQRRICGLPVVAFSLLVAGATFLVVGALVAAIVVAVAGVSRHPPRYQVSGPTDPNAPLTNAPLSTITVTQPTSTGPLFSTFPTTGFGTSTIPATATPSVPSANYGSYYCPSENGTVYTTNQKSFLRLCSIDYPAGTPAIGGGKVSDLENIIAYSVDSCITACAQLANCVAISYGADISGALAQGYSGNCWLKNDRSVSGVADKSGQQEGAYLE